MRMWPSLSPRTIRTSESPARQGRRRALRQSFLLETLEPRVVLSTAWINVGPAPTINGQDEGIASPQGANPVSGAIDAVAIVPGSSDVIYAGTVNGGVWKTTNATAATPNWTPLTDQQLPSGAIGAVAVSPLDNNVIFAGSAKTSSYANDGVTTFGIARSTDAGATWSVVAPALAGQNVTSVIPTTQTSGNSQIVLASSNAAIFRSTDGGSTFASVLAGGVSSMVADGSLGTRFYAARPGVGNGIFVSNDTGATWQAVGGSGLGAISASNRVLLATNASAGVLYAMVINSSGNNVTMFRSANQGANFTAMGAPSPTIMPGGQGSIHAAIAASPTDPNFVIISGDRQNSPFPNANGASNFSGNIFIGTFNVTGGTTTWTNAVMTGANGTSPHADSRAMVFDAAGNVVQANDGGIFRLNNPTLGTRAWVSINGNITPTEAHSAAYDPLSKVYMAGTQDTGTSIQTAPGSLLWNDFTQGDGGKIQIDADQTAHPGTTIRYTGFTGLAAFRSTWNAANVFQSFANINYLITSGPNTGLTINNADANVQFYNPYILNRVNPARMLIGTANIYESLDRGATVANLGFTAAFIGDGFGNNPLAYGGYLNGVANPGVFYVGAGTRIYFRSGDGQAVTTLNAYPGGTVRGLVLNPNNWQQVYVLDTSNRIFGSSDAGATWTNLTANLPTLSNSVRTIEIFSPDGGIKNTVLLVGGQAGVFQLRRPTAAGTSWTPVGTGLPIGALVYDLRYDYTDNILTVGTLGRGVWSLSQYFRGGGGTGLNPPTGNFGGAELGDQPVFPDPIAPPINYNPDPLALPVDPDGTQATTTDQPLVIMGAPIAKRLVTESKDFFTAFDLPIDPNNGGPGTDFFGA